MVTFYIQTLVDITRTGAYRRELGTELERAQQQNFDMLLQTIGMRANPSYDYSPTSEIVDLSECKFGYSFTGEHRVWRFTFNVEYLDAFLDEFDNECGLLVNDLHHVPIVHNLLETSPILPYFDTRNAKTCNTLIFPFHAKY